MEFNGQYLTREEYLQLGGTVPDEMPFNLLEFNARKCIDKYTFGRLIDLTTQTQEVKLCVFELIEKINSYSFNNEERTNKSISSENTDGYSVSYSTDFDTLIKSKEAEIRDVIYNYLATSKLENGIPYLYRG